MRDACMSGDDEGETCGDEGFELLGESECAVIGIAKRGMDANGSLTFVLSTFMSVT
jgi:hypothetical protein